MATRTGYPYPLNTAAADFRQWINEINNAILAMGWTASSDTGQVNFATVAAPVGTSNYPGYAIYQMTDALAGTYPFYLKLSFGSASGGQPAPSLVITLCTSTNGAGTPTGNISTPFTFNAGSSSATTGACYTTGTTSRLTMAFWMAGPTASIAFLLNVERTLDTSGAETNTGAIIRFSCNGSGNYFQQVVPSTGAVPPIDGKWLCYGPSNTGAAAVGQNYSTISALRGAMGPLTNPEMGFMMGTGAWAFGAPVSITRYGNTKLYIALSATSGYAPYNSAMVPNGISPNAFMLWE